MTSSTSSSERPAAPSYTWKTFSRQLCVVLAVFIAANLVTYWSSEYFEKEHRYHEAVQAAAGRKGARVLFVGDSHFAQPLNGYLNEDPAAIAYSVAFGGDSLRECFAKIRYVLQANPTIDTLMVSADPHMFGSGRVESSNRSFADGYFLRAGDKSGLPNGWLSTVLDQVPLFNDDFVQYLRKAAGTSFGKRRVEPAAAADGPAEESGWSGLSDADRASRAREIGRMDHQGVGEHREPFAWYARILQLARAHNVRVIGVRFPVHNEYSAQVSPARVAQIDQFLREQGAADIVDLRAALTDPHDFNDPDHLNQDGAEKTLRLLSERVHYPLVANAAHGTGSASP